MLHYIEGDLFEGVQRTRGRRVIVHVCNDIGGFESGFVVALSKHYPKAEAEYRAWFEKKVASDHVTPFALGEVDFVVVRRDVIVANMVAQVGVGPSTPLNPRVHYEALGRCLAHVAYVTANMSDVSFHLPRIGCDLGGGSWAVVEKLIQDTLVTPSTTWANGRDTTRDVYVYTLPGSHFNP